MDRLDHVEWSVWYGPVNLAPGGYQWGERFYRNRLAPLINRIRNRGKGKKKKDKPPSDDDFYETPPPVPVDESAKTDLEVDEGQVDRERQEVSYDSVDEPISEKIDAELPIEESPESYDDFESAAEPLGFDEFFDDDDDAEFETDKPSGSGIRQLDEIKGRIKGLVDKIQRGRKYLEQYGPFGKKVLRRLYRLALRYWRALRWKKLYVRFASGGDPSSLGAAQGWLYALDGALEGRLNGHIIFEPDFETHTFEPKAEAAVDLRIHLILFIPPTVDFLVRFPWIGLYKTVQQIRKEQG